MSKKQDSFPTIFLIPFLALIIPLFLLPFEKILPYPAVIEELIKAAAILFILKLAPKNIQLKIILLATFLFSLSENLFYLNNFIANGIFASFFQRFLMTTILHLLTSVIILLPAQRKINSIFWSTPLAILIHFLYNHFVLILF